MRHTQSLPPRTTTIPQSSTVTIYSFDFDGSLAHTEYYQRKKNFPAYTLTHANEPFLTRLTSLNNPQPSLTVVMNGSNRQSVNIDSINRKSAARDDMPDVSIFNELPAICNALPHAVLDCALLSDVFCDLEFGEAWKLAIAPSSERVPGCPLFENKIPLLYFQMHYTAKKYGKDKIISFQFFDNSLDILNTLGTYFSTYPALIPANMTLFLKHYAGEIHSQLRQIKGTGALDTEFRKTTIAYTIAVRTPVRSGWNLTILPQFKMKSVHVSPDTLNATVNSQKTTSPFTLSPNDETPISPIISSPNLLFPKVFSSSESPPSSLETTLSFYA